MSGREPKNSPERNEPLESASTMPIETPDLEDIETGDAEMQADDELAILGERQVDADDAGLPEEDDDNPYQESDEALPDDEEEAEISRDPEREGHRFE